MLKTAPFYRRPSLYSLCLLAILLLHPALSAQTADLQQLLRELSESPALQGAQWSVSARHCDSGLPLIRHNSDLLLAPASGLKAVTTALAVHWLGEDFRFRTEVHLTGQQTDGDWIGDLIIIGSGDPSLASRWIPGAVRAETFFNSILSALQSKGISSIQGDLIIDNSLFADRSVPDHWVWQDIGNYYGTGMQSFCFRDNLYEISFKPAQTAGSPAPVLNTLPRLYDFSFTNLMMTGPVGSGDNGYIYSAPGMKSARLTGTVPAAVPSFTIKGALIDPPGNTLQELRDYLASAGLTVSGQITVLTDSAHDSPDISTSPRIRTLLCSFESPPLKDILLATNRRSINLSAEMCLRAAAYYAHGIRSYEEALSLYLRFFSDLGLEKDGTRLFDGSGLSRTNMISSSRMTEVLAAVTEKPYFQAWYSGLSVAGVRDSLGFMSGFASDSPAAGNARVKSGYIQNVHSHSGYVTDSEGRIIAFSCIANNYTGRTSEIRALHEAVVIALARYPKK